MKERKETINLVTANIVSIAILIVAVIVGLLYYYLVTKALGHKIDLSIFTVWNESEWWRPLVDGFTFLMVIIGGTVIHELVHGITWAHYCKNGWHSISFGVLWKMLTPYCHCDEPLSVPHYRTGALMPLYVVGILPLLLSPFLQSFALCAFGILFVAAASGDLMVVWRLRKEKPTSMVLDHPSEAGYLIREEE